ncbi:MAG: fatty acid hydroxylase [Sphingomonadales bacterium]|nr:fatty acid hydroxylase [Sphingomonadales bacterium]
MEFEKIHNKGQARLFKSDFLEALTKAHPLVIWGMYLPVLLYLPYRAHTVHGFGASSLALYFFLGIFCWTLFEYIAHRFLFHWVPNTSFATKVVYTMHGNHHHFPRDRQRLFMPPLPSLLFACLLFGIFFLLMGSYALLFFPGFLLGYLLYASMHYAIHAWNPPFKWMKPLWRNHHLHHYKNEHHGFGVSSTLWDLVFGTMFDLKNEKEDKEKVNGLMFEKRP